MIITEGVPALIECFEGMNNCFINAAFSSESIDYELDKKMQIFTNMSIMLARLYEFNVKNDDAVRVCDILLQKQLPSHLTQYIYITASSLTHYINGTSINIYRSDKLGRHSILSR